MGIDRWENLTRVRATVPVIQPPTWAILQQSLFAALDSAWREFERDYTQADGRLRYDGRMFGRDGADDFYEPFFNWPILYLLGGSDDLLPAAKKHWEGVTRQLTELGFVQNEYERGYDWFHQGESALFFYALCAADPTDQAFRARAKRFAGLYLPSSRLGNYDPTKKIIVAPHTGSAGPLPGVGEDWDTYSARQTGMKPYGLPLGDVASIRTWDDLVDDENALKMGRAMQERMGSGDTAINLAATALAANAWLFDNDSEYADWIIDYVDAWRQRAADNDGLLPDNVGPDGFVGSLHNGAWFGGHYGWTWPHGLHSVESAALIASTSAALVTGEDSYWDLSRTPLDTVIEQAETKDFDPAAATLGRWWLSHLGKDLEHPIEVVPYRFGPDGWFDWHPVPLQFVFWLWWNTGDDQDRSRLQRVLEGSGYDWKSVRQFHDKEEGGHESSWYAWLTGHNDDYPEESLLMALGQVARRLALMRHDDKVSQGDDIHWWQQLNPVVTEVLSQQVFGAPADLYNGGLPPARLRYWDTDRRRAGLPPGVSTLVTRLEPDRIDITLVNTTTDFERNLLIQAGAYGQDRIVTASYDTLSSDWPGTLYSPSNVVEPTTEAATLTVDSNRLAASLPPLTQLTLRLDLMPRAFTARHQTFTTILKGQR